jgi:hypothetical protein
MLLGLHSMEWTNCFSTILSWKGTMFSLCLHTQSTLAISLAFCLGLAEPSGGDDNPDPSDTQAKPKAASQLPATPVNMLAFSPDGKFLAIADENLRLYDLATGRELSRLGWPSGSQCRHLAFSPDGRRIVSTHDARLIGEPDFYVHLWEVTPETKLGRVAELLARKREDSDFFTDVYQASFSPDSRTVVAGSAGETIYLWDCATAKERLQLHGGVAAAFSADGKTLLAVSHDGLIRRFDAASGKPIAPPKDFVRSDYIFTKGVTFAAAGDCVAVWDQNQVLLLDSQTGKRISRLTFPGGTRRVTLSADGRSLIVVEKDNGIWFFDAATGKELGWRAGGNGEFGDAGSALARERETLIWVEREKHLKIQPLQDVLAGCAKGPSKPQSDPPDVPLQAELIARQDRFVVNLGKLTPEDFSNKLTRSFSFEPDPDVERRKDASTKTEKQKEIERKLIMPVSFEFKKTPLHQVVEDLRTWTGLNIVVDKQGLEEEKISMDQPVEMKIDGVSLRGALSNILRQMRLTYEIEDEVLKITTEADAKNPQVLIADLAKSRIISCPNYAFRSAPRVDLEFRVRNTGEQAFTFSPDLDPDSFLAGPGALNIYWPCQTVVGPGIGGDPVKPITLKPGEKYSVRVRDLKLFGFGSQSLWVLPGEYSIYARCRMSVTPAPKGTKPDDDSSAWITLRSPPLKVKVVAAEK